MTPEQKADKYAESKTGINDKCTPSAFILDRHDEIKQAYLAGAREATEWVKVSDRVPDKEGMYLCFLSDSSMRVVHYNDNYETTNKWHTMGGYIRVTHWMPLPTPPQD